MIGDHALPDVTVRTHDSAVPDTILEAIRRIVVAGCQASNSPKAPDFELYEGFPGTVNDAAVTAIVETAFAAQFR